MNQTVLWGELDRWSYSDPDVPAGSAGMPPPYTLYTYLTLGQSFLAFLVITASHTLVMLIVKIATSREFRSWQNLLGKFIHVIENLSLATPYRDWDEGVHTISKYRERFRRTNIEMSCCLIVNAVVSMIMLVPLLFTGNVFILILNMHSTFIIS